MNKDESKVKEYLKYKGFSNIVFEPNGNVPPDFLVNKKIAVEVRRLNENKEVNGQMINLESDFYAVYSIVREVCSKIRHSANTNSAYLRIQYERPLDLSKIKRSIKAELTNLLNNTQSFSKQILTINKNFIIQINPSNEKKSFPFVVDGYSDYDQGGAIVDLLYRNLDFAIKEKAKKIAPRRANYSEWWLILVDYVSYFTDEYDINQLKELPKIDSDFNKVILISSQNHKHGITLYE